MMKRFLSLVVGLGCLGIVQGSLMADDYIEISRVTDAAGGVSANEDYISLSAVGQSYHTSSTIGEDFINQSGFINTLDVSNIYQVIEGSFTWHEAKADAEARWGHLATIASQEEYDKIKELAGRASYFLGGTDEDKEGNWSWVTGEEWDYTNWLAGEPNNQNVENYLAYNGGAGWNDTGVESMGGYILEFSWANPRLYDTDWDGLNDWEEIYKYKTNPRLADTDGDGCSDGDEVNTHKTDPLLADTDGDGLSDCQEINVSGTNPNEEDHDGDGHNDGPELAAGTDPKDPKSFPTLTTGLIAYYPFNGNANDESGNGNDGTVHGATLTEDRFGESGKAYDFDGKNNYIKIPDSSLLDLPNIGTISLWLYANPQSQQGPYGGGTIINKYRANSEQEDGYHFGLDNEDGFYTNIKNYSDQVPMYIDDEFTSKGNWILATICYDKKNLKLYIDGVLVGKTEGFAQTSGNSRSLLIGASLKDSDAKVSYFTGQIDDIRIYNRALSEAEVAELYELEKPDDVLPPPSTYEIIEGNFTWHEAKVDAEARGGHLATVTSDLEQSKINELIIDSDKKLWLGATDEDSEGNWKWVTDVSFDYTNWDVGGDFDDNDNENYMFIRSAKWGDYYDHGRYLAAAGLGSQNVIGYILEFSSESKRQTVNPQKDSDGDGLPDADEVEIFGTNPQLFDTDGDGMSDGYEVGIGRYKVVLSFDIKWPNASTEAETYGGHLLKVDSKDEWTAFKYVANRFDKNGFLWIGAEWGGDWLWEDGTAVGDAIVWADSEDSQGGHGEPYAYADNRPVQDVGIDRFSIYSGGKDTVPKSARPRGYIVEIGNYTDPTISDLTSTYEIVEGSFTWHEAKADAEARGGHLAVITSEAEQKVISGIVYEKGDYWIGGTDEDSEGNWGWVTGEQWNYENWAQGEPNSGGPTLDEDFTEMNGKGDFLGTWNDSNSVSIDSRGYILEIPQLERGLIAYYPFNGNANDESGNGNHGEVSGATLVKDRFAVSGSSYELDADDVITVSNPFEGMQSFTKSLWFRGIDDESGLLRSSACEIKLYKNRFSIHFNESRTNGSYSRKHRYYADVKQDQLKPWNQLIVSAKNDNEFSMYLNGNKLKVGSVATVELNGWGNEPCMIGYKRSGSSRGLDDVRIYNRALTSFEAKKLYELEKVPKSTYQIVEGNFTWHEAKADAEAKGGHLVTITSEAEWIIIHDLLGDSLNDDLWIGGTDAVEESVWTWVTGENWEYTRWDNDAPNSVGGNEDYLNIPRSDKASNKDLGYWNDHDASPVLVYDESAGGQMSGYILEIPQVDLERGLIAYYPFNGNANDESGNGNDGIVNGSTLTSDRNGDDNAAYEFDGLNGYIDTGKNGGVDNSFSLAVWFKPETFKAKNQRIFSWGPSDEDRNEIRLQISDKQESSQRRQLDATIIDESGFGGGTYKTYIGNTELNAGTWYHAVMTWDGVNLSLTLDGKSEPVEKAVDGSVTLRNVPRNRFIGAGRNVSQSSFDGQIDDIRIYNRALSEAEVAELYDLEKPDDVAPPPPSEYKIIEGSFTWHEAKADAEARGGHLATITSEAEQAYIGDLVSSSDIHLWLGGTDEDSEGNWTWVTEEIWEYNNWFLGGLFAGQNAEPSNGGGLEHHLHILGRSSLNGIPVVKGQWNDAPSSGQWNDAPSPIKGYILEIPNVDLESDLVAYYPFNGNANDESGNGNDGTVSGATLAEDRFGETDKAYDFDGDSSKILINEDNLDIFGSRESSTISFWINPRSLSSDDSGIFTKGFHSEANENLGNRYLQISLASGGGPVYSLYNYAIISNIHSIKDTNAETWSHVVFVRDAVGRVFINGEDVTNAGGGIYEGWAVDYNAVLSDKGISIGAMQFRESTDQPIYHQHHFDGQIDDIRIYNRALTSAEVAALYDLEQPPKITSPVITWATPEAITYCDTLSEVQLNASANVPGSFSYEPELGTKLPAGEHTLKATFTPEDGELDPVVAEVLLVVNPLPLLVQAKPATRLYGVKNPNFGADISNFCDGEDMSVFTEFPEVTSPTDEKSPVGTYVITPSGGSAPNYILAYSSSKLTITKAPLTARAVNQVRAYGQENPAFELVYDGFVNGEDDSVLTTPISASTSATKESLAGEYPIVLSGGEAPNYIITLANGTLTVGRQTPVITWAEPAPITYGTPIDSKQLNSQTDVEGSFDYTPIAGDILDAGEVTLRVTFTPAILDNYATVDAEVVLTINKAPLTVTAVNASRAYGEANTEFELVYDGFVNGEDESVLTTPVSPSTPGGQDSPPGEYPIELSGGEAANYEITLVNGTLTVGRQTPVITWSEPAPITYGTSIGPKQLNAQADVEGFFVYSPPGGAILDAGEITLRTTFTPSDLNSSSKSDHNVPLTVKKAPLTITVANASRDYGEANPAFELVYDGFVNGEDESALSTPVCVTTPAKPDSEAGEYPVVLSCVEAANYEITLVNGTLTVGRQTPVITWSEPAPITYGASIGPKQLNAQADVEGFFVYFPPGGAILDAGEITLRTTFTPSDLNAYAKVDAEVVLTIGKAPLTVTAMNLKMNYGDDLPSLQFVRPGFWDEIVFTIPISISTPATKESPVGEYPIVLSGGEAPNYEITPVNGTLTINKAPLTVTVVNASRAYREKNPEFSTVYDGFVNDEDKSVLATPVSASTPATIDSPVGEYPIVLSGGEAPNYEITLVNGTLTIGRHTPVITWATPEAITYGDKLSEVQLNASADVDGTFAYETELGTELKVGTVLPAGEHTIKVTFNPSDDNYAEVDAKVVLTINKAPLTVTAVNASRAFGEKNPKFDLLYNGFVDGEDESVLLEEAVAKTRANPDSPPGDYPIVVSGGDARNYFFNRINGTLTIQDKVVPPVITAPPDTVFARLGDNVMFKVEARGAPIAYQWLKAGKPIDGAKANLLRLFDISNDDVGAYTVEVYNQAGKVVSFPAFLKIVSTPPVISDIPKRFDLVYESGETVILDPKIKTEGPTTFQWDKDGNELAGETNPILIIENVKDDDAGNYSVDATNLAGTTVSETMRVSVMDEAKIGKHVKNNFIKIAGFIDSSPAIGQDGSVYYSIAGEYGYLYRHEPNGVRKWGLAFDSALRGSPAIGDNGIIHVLEDAGALHAVSNQGSKGKIEWSYKLEGEEVNAIDEEREYGNSPAIAEDGTIIFGWFDSNVYAVREGELVWKFPTEGRVVSSPSIAPDGTIYIGTEDGFMYAIKPDGSAAWTKPFETGAKIMTRPAIDAEGNIYFGSFSGEFYALEPSRAPKWKFDTLQDIWTSAVIRADGTVYFGADDGYFYALDTESGKVKWTYEIEGNWQQSSTAALGLDGSIYFTLYDNTFYAINRIGEELWTVKLEGDGKDRATFSSPSLLDDGKIYVGTKDGNDGVINVIQGGSPIDNESPWPSFGGDMQNTGRVMVKRTDAESFKAELRVTEVSSDSLTIQVTGDAFETYKLQYSNDLKAWKIVPDLQSIQTNFRGRANFKRTPKPGSAPTFYRLLNE